MCGGGVDGAAGLFQPPDPGHQPVPIQAVHPRRGRFRGQHQELTHICLTNIVV